MGISTEIHDHSHKCPICGVEESCLMAWVYCFELSEMICDDCWQKMTPEQRESLL